MMTLPEIRSQLERVCIARAAKEARLGYHTVYRIARGTVSNPNHDTIKALSDWLGK